MNTNDEKNVLGHKQSDFAGTNTDRYAAPKPLEEQNNPIDEQEAQDVTDGERMSGEDAAKARTKANEGSSRH